MCNKNRKQSFLFTVVIISEAVGAQPLLTELTADLLRAFQELEVQEWKDCKGCEWDAVTHSVVFWVWLVLSGWLLEACFLDLGPL